MSSLAKVLRRELGLLFASFFCNSNIAHSRYILLSMSLYHTVEQKATEPLDWALPSSRLAVSADKCQ